MNSKKVVIVDDDNAILDSLKLMLHFEGFDVSTFCCRAEIIKFMEDSEKPHIIVLDMWLSGEDGREICRELKKNTETKDIPVIIMSASRGLNLSALECGANAFIAKPFEIDEIVKTLHHLTA
jgi:DNA-binding response OmpR family regulator